jgi:hypothetical protein
LDELRKNKNILESELEKTKEIISTDIGTFRKMAGVPTPQQIIRERFIGFISGVIASLIASGIIALVVFVFKNWTSIKDILS